MAYTQSEVEKAFIEHKIVPELLSKPPRRLLNVRVLKKKAQVIQLIEFHNFSGNLPKWCFS